MLRLLHTSDWHLGRFLYGKSLLDDQRFALERLIELIDRRRPHAILIAGDLFDRPFPPEAAVTLFDWFLSEVVGNRKTQVLLIPGNHDSCERLGFASKLLRGQGLTIFASPEDSFRSVVLAGDSGVEVSVFGIPFVEPPLIGRLLGRDDVRDPDTATSSLCRALLERHAKQRPAILMCHGFVTGSLTCESEKDLFIGGSSNIDCSAFEGFAYTALGHLHRPQSAGAQTIRYSGSLLPYSKSETDHEKTIVEVALDASGTCHLDHHVLPRLRGFRYLEGALEELCSKAKDDATPDDYVIAGFTDPGPVIDAFSKLRTHYPNLLHVARAGGYVPSQTPSLEHTRARQERSELDLFAEFFRETTNEDLNDDERAFLASTLQELSREGGAP